MDNGHIGIATAVDCIPTVDADATNVAQEKLVNSVRWCIAQRMG
jgi:hypothetical protein